MDFAFSPEQEMLRSQARDFLADQVPPERVAELADSESGWDPDTWKKIAELGWIGLSSPESSGGSGMSFLDEAVLFEELGYALYPGPYFATVGLALPALERDPSILERVMAGEATSTLALDPDRVVDGAIADVVVLVDRSDTGATLRAVGRDELTVKPLSTMDATRRFASIGGSAEGTLLAEGAEGTELLRHIRLRALAAASLEAVGVAQKALDLVRAYASERKQFEKPIGIYQAVSHQIADVYTQVELARSLAYWAAWCVAESDEQAERAVAAAKVQCSEAAVFACERSIQVHGGIGFTWEHILHRYYKRAQWLQSFGGFSSTHLAAIADSVLA
jgi:alkylation response protein AidB-like acyl-CoA dehydrogenase